MPTQAGTAQDAPQHSGRFPNNVGGFWPIGSAACSAEQAWAADEHNAATAILLLSSHPRPSTLTTRTRDWHRDDSLIQTLAGTDAVLLMLSQHAADAFAASL